MYWKIIHNDIVKNKLTTIIITVFISVAAMLVSLGAILAINLLGSIDTLMIQGEVPDFLQMHSGKIDIKGIETFAKDNDNVDDFQVLEFLNVDGDKIVFGDKSLRDSVQDNGFCIQSEKFDYLINFDGNIIDPNRGEVYVPVSYMKENITKVGDKATICGEKFTVAGFLRDSQMNSTLCLSKRFLISEEDYKEIQNYGNTEYLIEFRLKDLSSLNEFENSYISVGLESNGPVITYPFLRLLNGISDGIMIGVILLISVLVILIAFMCIRFTLLTTIEEDYREIGVMKAIGLRVSDIKKFYLAKYIMIAGISCLIGFLLSFLFRGILLQNIRLYMGESKNSSFALYFGIIGVLLVFFLIIVYIRRMLNRFKKISPSEAIRFGFTEGKSKNTKYFLLSKNKALDTNVFLGIKDVLSKKKLYSTMFIVFVISVFVMIVPQNLYNTISSKNFIRYMGIGNSDLRIDIQQVEDISAKTREVARTLESDNDIQRYAFFTTKAYTVIGTEGIEESIKVELGDHSVFPIEYYKGRSPITENEIALSIIKGEELNKEIGDDLTLVINGDKKDLKVCGVYSDITNGGKTAKASFVDKSADIMWSVLSIEISNKSLLSKKELEYGQMFPFAKVSGNDEYITQTFGQLIGSVKLASQVSLIIALLISILITLLFIKMLITKDRYSIAVMKSFGFTNSDITTQYVSRSVFVLFISIAIGTILANGLGEIVAGVAISFAGVSYFKFEINYLLSFVLYPLLIIICVLIATNIGTSKAGEVEIFENIRSSL